MGKFISYEKPFTKRWFAAYGNIVIGTFILSLGYVFFITPHKIVPGGVYGISIVLHHTLNTPVGITALFFNVPLVIIGTRLLGPRFGT
ncbi:MAG TPA: YitT family protein, partial [Salinivirgaceae bacterium]|nr:YitT family protein [Salinivirgaceae bacterium]